MSTSKILFQLSGSIACFKACSLLSSLVKAGHDVEVVATASALKFVGEATLEGLTGKRVHTTVFEGGRYMNHIHLVRWADLIVLAPASANTMNKFAAGLADDLVSTLFLAHDFKKPYLVAPAMNQAMYAHPATKAAIQRLTDWGMTVLSTGNGSLACGESGDGRMLEPDEVLQAIRLALTPKTAPAAAPIDTNESSLKSKNFGSSLTRRILITSGGTEEPIDGVRSITNTSTGRTGAELATWLADHGHRVTLIHAHSALLPQTTKNLQLRAFGSFETLKSTLEKTLTESSFDIVIHLAAVADFSLDEVESNGAIYKAPIKGKIESSDSMTLKLKRNPKLVDSLRAYSKNPAIHVVAFKLTHTRDVRERLRAVADLVNHAAPDMVVHNDLEDIRGGSHPFTIYGLGEAQPLAQVDGANALAAALSRLILERTKFNQTGASR